MNWKRKKVSQKWKQFEFSMKSMAMNTGHKFELNAMILVCEIRYQLEELIWRWFGWKLNPKKKLTAFDFLTTEQNKII